MFHQCLTLSLKEQTSAEIQSLTHALLLALFLTNPLSPLNQVFSNNSFNLTGVGSGFIGLENTEVMLFALLIFASFLCLSAPDWGMEISIILAYILSLVASIGGMTLATKTFSTFVPLFRVIFSQVVLFNPMIILFSPCLKVS